MPKPSSQLRKSSNAVPYKKNKFQPYRKPLLCPYNKTLSLNLICICLEGKILGAISFDTTQTGTIFTQKLFNLRKQMDKNNEWVYDQNLKLQDYAFCFQNTKVSIPKCTEKEMEVGDIVLQGVDNTALWAVEITWCTFKGSNEIHL